MQKFLVIQTAFIGDVVLATALVETLKFNFPDAAVDFLLRKGNESLLVNNPNIQQVIIWDKRKDKIKNLFTILKKIRSNKYDKVINLQRYFSTGILTAFSGAGETIGFDKNPLSFLFSKKVAHQFNIEQPRHEVERNNDLVKHFTRDKISRPKLYPSPADYELVNKYQSKAYVSMTPSSVWFTKKYPGEKWIDLMDRFDPSLKIYLLGGKDNLEECETLSSKTKNRNVEVLAGKLSFLQSAALMSGAIMNYTNDSAPLHFASAVNAAVTAIFCSTIPAFGYTALSDISIIVETREQLSCRPCGLHGHKKCPLGHFKCAYGIMTEQLLETIPIHT
ncbi:MAG: glycosyltransferase family 9 protein [Ferruginibacter sp.]